MQAIWSIGSAPNLNPNGLFRLNICCIFLQTVSVVDCDSSCARRLDANYSNFTRHAVCDGRLTCKSRHVLQTRACSMRQCINIKLCKSKVSTNTIICICGLVCFDKHNNRDSEEPTTLQAIGNRSNSQRSSWRILIRKQTT